MYGTLNDGPDERLPAPKLVGYAKMLLVYRPTGSHIMHLSFLARTTNIVDAASCDVRGLLDRGFGSLKNCAPPPIKRLSYNSVDVAFCIKQVI